MYEYGYEYVNMFTLGLHVTLALSWAQTSLLNLLTGVVCCELGGFTPIDYEGRN